MFCKIEDLLNESDVEQKFVIQMLTASDPLGFGFSTSEFKTKADLRRLVIGKGVSSKLYYPDYVIIIQGFPVLIIEVKHPNVELESACSEARLYAQELNAKFPHEINPCQKIIATNGKKMVATFSDTAAEQVSLSFDEIFVGSEKYSRLLDFCSKRILTDFINLKLNFLRSGTTFKRPINMLGGRAVQNEELEQNSFGATLALDYRYLFNPSTLEERKNIVKNAYVTTKKRISHVSPIERIIKSAIPLTMSSIKEIEETGRPTELTSKFKNISSLKNEILLLVGGVGSGKSTFIDYLTEVALHQDVKDKTVWLSVDLNKAPLSKEEIYKWLCESLMSKFKELYSDIDFEELNTLKKLYSIELRKIEKGPAALFDPSTIEYKNLIASELQKLLNNPIHSLKAFVRYMCRERGKLAVVVLDNCDRRKRDDQLLMFEVAKWMQNEFECLVVLPIRDTTFDHHRKEPPLDTVIKDLVFRIDPPLLAQVIAKRIGFALAAMSKDRGEQKGEELLSYVLPNSMRVEYPRSEQGIYLACILRSLFTDSLFRRIVTGISGRDIRRGLEIFLEFCKSGHITPDEILKIRQSQGDYTLPKHIIMRLILRGNRRYFQDAGSSVKNLFFSYPEEIVPDPFIRLEILKWLEKSYRKFGPSGIKGYHKITDLCSDMVSLGHSIDKVKNELAQLMRVGCVVSETQDSELINEGDLISISPSGHVHLDLVNNVDYLAACSEDVWYKNNEVAGRIWKRMTNQIGRGHFSHETSILNAEDLANYLQIYRTEFISQPESYLEDGHFEKLFDISDALLNIERAKAYTNLKAEEKLINTYPPGTIIESEIISIQNYGIFVQFGINAVGFIYIAKMSHLGLNIYSLELGNRMMIKIIEYSSKHKRFDVEPVLET